MMKRCCNSFSKLWILAVSLLLSSTALAQVDPDDVRVQIATQEPPYYVGVPAIIQLQVRGFDADPQPDCKVESPSKDIQTRISSVNPQIFQQMVQRNGRIERTEHVTYTIRLRVTASKDGDYQVGPFVVSQNGVEKKIDALDMTFDAVPETEDMKIRVELPPYAYPDQRVPVNIEWWFKGSTEDIQKLNITSPVFDEFLFEPDPQAGRGVSRLPIETSQGTVLLGANAREEVEDDTRFTVVTANRTLIPSRPGTYELDPATATVEMVTQWQRRRSTGMFGGSLLEEAFGNGRRASKIEMYRATGEPLTFEVKPFPTSGRPESFSGAVGKGFSMDVSADRTVVRVGDPIRLTISLHGDGNLETASLPSLSADGGLDPQKFRLPDGVSTGQFDSDNNQKQFQVSVRVSEESVGEIPSIAYSWFDAENETYRTTRSKPIALRVMPANMVGADAVVSAGRDGPSPQVDSDLGTTAERKPTPKDHAFSLSGADLSIQRDPSELLGFSQSILARPGFRYGGYVLGTLCVVAALIDRRRSQVDPAKRRRDRLFADAKREITDSRSLVEDEAAPKIANALQSILPEVEREQRQAIDAVLAQCQAISYRPSGQSGTINRELADTALTAIEGIRSEVVA